MTIVETRKRRHRLSLPRADASTQCARVPSAIISTTAYTSAADVVTNRRVLPLVGVARPSTPYAGRSNCDDPRARRIWRERRRQRRARPVGARRPATDVRRWPRRRRRALQARAAVFRLQRCRSLHDLQRLPRPGQRIATTFGARRRDPATARRGAPWWTCARCARSPPTTRIRSSRPGGRGEVARALAAVMTGDGLNPATRDFGVVVDGPGRWRAAGTAADPC